MMRIAYIVLFHVFLLISLLGFGQSKIFTQEQLLWYVKNYHPVAVQGNLLLKEGESTVRSSRGAFDPYLHGDFDQKYFDDKNYFSMLGTGLKIPTWYGVELKTGFDQNRGVFLNPENDVPNGGLWFAGLSVPIGQGLFIDKRRAALQQAQIFSESTQAEQRKLMNDLYFDAVKQYWKWTEVWNQYQVYEEAVELAVTRFNAVKQSFLLGDKPAIDTLEAFIQIQNRQMNRNQFQLLYQNLTLELSNFLWFENNTPLVITDSIHPPSFEVINVANIIPSDTFTQFLTQIEEQHPEMQLYAYKLNTMEIEKRLKIEGLKPKLNLNYNALTEPVGNNFVSDLSTENYKWGVDFSFPIFLRKQRGELQLTQIKIQNTALSQQQKLLELQNKLRSYYNEQINLNKQVNLFMDAVDNYDGLLEGERQKFNTGESSLFLVNSRETNLIKARLKLMELKAKYQVALAGLVWASGELYDE